MSKIDDFTPATPAELRADAMFLANRLDGAAPNDRLAFLLEQSKVAALYAIAEQLAVQNGHLAAIRKVIESTPAPASRKR